MIRLGVSAFLRSLAIASILLSLASGFAVAAQTDAEQSKGSEESEYRLGPEDVIQVQIWGRPDLSGSVPIDLSGKIQLPLVGQVDAKGRTTGELSSYVKGRYRLLDPSIPDVLITVAQYNSQSVTVVGEVRAPGKYGFRTLPDLWTLILTAGGATPTADLARIKIVRKERADGEPSTLTVDLSRGIDRPAAEGLPALMTKDVIVIPSLAETSIQGDQFQVLGAVRTPGIYRTGAARTIVEAISLSGGTLPQADLRRVSLTRPGGDGVIRYQVDLESHLIDGKPLVQSEIKPGDTITVPERHPGGSVFDVVARFAPLISLATAVTTVIIATR